MNRPRLIAACAAASLVAGLVGSPALAQPTPVAAAAPQPTATMVYPGHWGGPFGLWYGGWQPEMVVNVPQATAVPAPAPAQWQGGYDREGWLRECRRRLGDNGVGGAVIGGVVGGVAGHALAGSGNRTVGTVVGAAAGAVAGAAIDKAEDRARVQDRCEAMLAAPAAGYGPAGYGYAGPVMLVPVVWVPAPGGAPGQPAGTRRPCQETVVTEETYEPVARRTRYIPRRAVPDKRVRIAPDKRIAQ